MKTIPDSGIHTEVRIKEAATTELKTIINLVRSSLVARFAPGDGFIPIESIYHDRVVIEQDGRLYSYSYTIGDDNQVVIGDSQEVIINHEPVSAMRESKQQEGGVFIEAKDGGGARWLIRVLQSGLSHNKFFYPDTVLREAAPLFDGTRVFVKSDEDHINGKGKSFRNLIGRLVKTMFVEGSGRDDGQIVGELEILESCGDVATKLREAWDRGMAKDLFGFSIDAYGFSRLEPGRRVAKSINKVNSLDLIIDPSAGGEIINLIEAKNPETERIDAMSKELIDRMVEAIKKNNDGELPEGLDIENVDALETAYREAIQTPDDKNMDGRTPAAKAATDDGKAGDGDKAVSESDIIRMVEARHSMRDNIKASSLPDIAKQRLINDFSEMDRFTEADVSAAIKSESEYAAGLSDSGKVKGVGDTNFIEAGEQFGEKIDSMLDAFFDPKNSSVSSFKECYINITGDKLVTGLARNCDISRMREAVGNRFVESVLTTGFSNVLGDAMQRRMIQDYRVADVTDIWRLLAGNPVPLSDFRTQHRTRWGGYGDLSIVAQGQAYPALSTPTDEEATYAAAKRGGTEEISVESIKNDDVGLIRAVPGKMSKSAKRTLAKFVLDFLRTNPTIYDALALFHATHNNLGTTAFAAAAFATARLAILQQTEKDSGERLGITGRLRLWVPSDLEEAAFDEFRRDTNNDETFVQTLKPMVIPVWYWTDANDYVVTADPADAPLIEIGFLDGQEEPEMFIQDNPTQGSMFSNDVITYKIRHIYSGAPVDYRPAYKQVVA